MEPDKKSLLDPAFLRKLERMRIQSRRAFSGTTRGERRSTRRGASVEFADFRKYEAGDDFRHVDWNIYARLERLMLRQFIEEEEVRVDLLIDSSRSMLFGEPRCKFEFAVRAAAALAFLAVSGLDRVGVAAFDSAIRGRLRALRGRGHLMSVIAFLNELVETVETNPPETAPEESTRTDIATSLRAYQKLNLRAGVVFVISDFLDDSDFRDQIKLLAGRGYDVNLIQVLSAAEARPELVGDLLLVDSETGEEREITINARMLAAYRATLARFTTELETFCRANAIGYLMATTDADFEDLLLKNLIESRMAE
jgi:uncharacterized protein (DUF58 family)